jgi:beta-N-acetylhexosaminidase
MRKLSGSTPSARRLGRAGPKAARDAGEELGDLARSIDADLVLAPVLDLDDGPSDGVIGDRSFGDDPDGVAETAGTFADAVRDAGVAVTLKHFPGHGSARGDPHAGVAVDDRTRQELLREDVVPFDALIDDGAEVVMVGHVAYPKLWGSTPASLSPGAYALLRERGFEGVAITDAMGMGAVYNQWGFDQGPTMAIAAGADAVLANQGDRVLELRNGLVTAVGVGDLDESRLDEAVARILALRGQDPTGILCA